MLTLIVALSLVRTVLSIGCAASLEYDFTSGTTPSIGDGFMLMVPVNSVSMSNQVAVFTGTGTLLMYQLSSNGFQGTHAISFNFQPPNPAIMVETSIITNDLTDDAGSFMITWSAGQVTLKLGLRLWNTTTLQFETRTELLVVTGLDLTVSQTVLFSKDNSMVSFGSGPSTGGGFATPLTLSLKHDESVELTGWDPLTIGTGNANKYSGFFDNFAYFKCIPTGFFP